MVSLTTRIDNLEYNGFINGAHDLWQRGTASTSLGGGGGVVYLADRWFGQHVGTATVNLSQDTAIPTVAQSGFQSTYSMKLTCSAGHAGDSLTGFGYTMEGYDWARFHGRACRLQFWVNTSVAGTYSIRLRNGNSDIAYLTSYTISAGQINTYVPIYIDIPANTAGTFTFLNGAGMNFFWALQAAGVGGTANQWTAGNAAVVALPGQVDWSANTGATFNIAQVMLIPQDFTLSGTSSIVVPFQRHGRTIQQETAACQRYYQRLTTEGNTSTAFFSGVAVTTNIWQGYHKFPVTMRRAPTAIETTGTSSDYRLDGTNTATVSGGPVFSSATTFGIIISCNGSSALIAGQFYTMIGNVGNNGFLGWSAEF